MVRRARFCRYVLQILGSAILTFSEILTLGLSDFLKPFTAIFTTIVALCKIDDTPPGATTFFF
jgi:hypothetical protein